MIPQRCVSSAGEFGDCYRACVASILELPAEQVPHFGALSTDSDQMKAHFREWLAARGLALFENWVSGQWSLEKVLKLFSKDSPGAPFILHGEAAAKGAGDINHAVVALDGEIHDPSGAGICGPCVNIEGERLHWWIDVITLASVDGRRMAETGTGSGRSPTSAVPSEASADAQTTPPSSNEGKLS